MLFGLKISSRIEKVLAIGISIVGLIGGVAEVIFNGKQLSDIVTGKLDNNGETDPELQEYIDEANKDS